MNNILPSGQEQALAAPIVDSRTSIAIRCLMVIIMNLFCHDILTGERGRLCQSFQCFFLKVRQGYLIFFSSPQPHILLEDSNSPLQCLAQQPLLSEGELPSAYLDHLPLWVLKSQVELNCTVRVCTDVIVSFDLRIERCQQSVTYYIPCTHLNLLVYIFANVQKISHQRRCEQM